MSQPSCSQNYEGPSVEQLRHGDAAQHERDAKNLIQEENGAVLVRVHVPNCLAARVLLWLHARMSCGYTHVATSLPRHGGLTSPACHARGSTSPAMR